MADWVFSNVTTLSLLSGDSGFSIKVVIEYVAKLPNEQDEADGQHTKFQHFPLPFWPGLQYLDRRHLWAVFCGNTHSFNDSYCWMNPTLNQKLTLPFALPWYLWHWMTHVTCTLSRFRFGVKDRQMCRTSLKKWNSEIIQCMGNLGYWCTGLEINICNRFGDICYSCS